MSNPNKVMPLDIIEGIERPLWGPLDDNDLPLFQHITGSVGVYDVDEHMSIFLLHGIAPLKVNKNYKLNDTEFIMKMNSIESNEYWCKERSEVRTRDLNGKMLEYETRRARSLIPGFKMGETFDLAHPASCAYRLDLSEHEWTWTHDEQIAMAKACLEYFKKLDEIEENKEW